MDTRRKQFLRREMLACSRAAAAEFKYGTTEQAHKWLTLAAQRLAELGGMAACW